MSADRCYASSKGQCVCTGLYKKYKARAWVMMMVSCNIKTLEDAPAAIPSARVNKKKKQGVIVWLQSACRHCWL